MTQVYVVECGTYDDKHIVAIFTTAKQANDYAAVLGDEAHVTAWELDPAMPSPPAPRWSVVMLWDGTVEHCACIHQRLHMDDITILTTAADMGKYCHVTCFATDKYHAITIAQEQRKHLLLKRDAQAAYDAAHPLPRKIHLG